jgi:hypothetical protein
LPALSRLSDVEFQRQTKLAGKRHEVHEDDQPRSTPSSRRKTQDLPIFVTFVTFVAKKSWASWLIVSASALAKNVNTRR